MNVVSNTSPIIFLSKLEALDLLPQCFEKIFIPQAVTKELRNLSSPDYIKCIEISIAGANFVLGALDSQCTLHAGELEAIVLAQEIQADYIILDDRLARRKAQNKGLKTIGTIGVLLLAHQQKFISTFEIERYLTALTKTYGMYLSPKILKEVKKTIQNNES